MDIASFAHRPTRTPPRPARAGRTPARRKVLFALAATGALVAAVAITAGPPLTLF